MRGDLEDLSFIAGSDKKITPFVFHDVPYMSRIQPDQRLKLFGKPDDALVAHDRLFELGLVKMLGPVMMPNLHLAGLGGRNPNLT